MYSALLPATVCLGACATVSSVQSGDLIDHYRLVGDLGAGAFATVWLARDEFLDADVAIKVLADNWARNEDVRGRFIDEAKILRRIDHDRIVRVFAVTELAGGQPAFVMTYADRGTLADKINDRRAQARRFGVDEVAAIGIELAGCLRVVHDFGVIHRDLKPTNVLFRSPRRHEQVHISGGESSDPSSGDVMVLADFGLAKDTFAASGFTMAAGTPAYMPPEQARTTSELDARADIYSATAILFELLTGAAPFDASSLSGVGRSRAAAPRKLSELRADIPAVWQRVMDRGLAADPADRYASADEFAAAITSAADASGIAVAAPDAPPVGVGGSELTGVRRRVDEIVSKFDGERSAGVDRRLRGPCTVGVVGSSTDVDAVGLLAGPLGFDVVRLAVDDVRQGDVDLVVFGTEQDSDAARRQLTEVLTEAPAGPIGITSVDVPDLARLLGVIERRADVLRASAALRILDATVRRAGSSTLSESWVRVGNLVESIRFDFPAFADFAALRAEVAGQLVLPAGRRADLRRLFFEADATRRLGLDDDASESEQLDAAVVQLSSWREFQDSGRVPFSARSEVDAVVRSVERLWATLAGYQS